MKSSDLEQLYKARDLAMEKSPEQMLPKVLETAESMYLAVSDNEKDTKMKLASFLTHNYYDILTSDLIPSSEKPFIASQHLQTLFKICCDVNVDPVTYKYAILSFSSSYSLLFDLVAKTSKQELWNTMQELKDFIITRWRLPYPQSGGQFTGNENAILDDESHNIGCKLAAIKLISEIVIVHTPYLPNSSGKVKGKVTSTISLASVPDNHPVISNKQMYESEAKKLLDSLLSYLVEQPFMVSSLFVGIINCLSFVMKQRPQATVRILSGLLRFNVDAKFQMDTQETLNYRLAKRFVERAYKNFVQFGLKSQLIRNSGSIANFYTKLSKISQTLHVIGEETKSKGIMNYDPSQIEHKMKAQDREKVVSQVRKLRSSVDDLIKARNLSDGAISNSSSSGSNFERNRTPPINVDSPEPKDDIQYSDNALKLSQIQKYTLSKNSTSGFFNDSPVALDNTYSSIYSLMNSNNSGIDVCNLPHDLLLKLCSETLYKADTKKMLTGLSIVASRYSDLMNKYKTKKRRQEDDEMAERLNKRLRGEDVDLDMAPKKQKVEDTAMRKVEPEVAVGTTNNKTNDTVYAIEPTKMSEVEKKEHFKRIISNIMNIRQVEETPEISTSINTKLKPLQKIKLLQWNSSESWLQILTRLATRGVNHDGEMSDMIRTTLYDYFLENFNERAGVALEWLNEEWYNETVTKISNDADSETPYLKYDTWSLKVLDGLIPSLENQHRRLFIRLMSELPRVTLDHIKKIRSVCLDPARSALGFQVLKFLVMFRPPTKPLIKDFLEELKAEDQSTEKLCNAILDKYYK